MTEAARRLHVSQPAVSTVLKHAEQRLGMKLFERTGGRLVPTPEAIALLPDVEDIFMRLEAFGRSAKGLREAASGVIAIAASPTLANAVLPAAIAAFTSERPKVHIVLRAMPTAQILSGVRDRVADLGLIYEPAQPMDDDLAGETVCTSQVACVMHRDHPLSSRRALRPVDLDGERLVTFGPATPLGARIDAAFRAEGVTPNVMVESSSSLTSFFVVAAGCGVALVDSSAAIGAFPTLVVREFTPRIENRIILLHRRDRPRSRIAAAFARQLIASLR
jgi:DNA-binding transcriptional LysR family regulator